MVGRCLYESALVDSPGTYIYALALVSVVLGFDLDLGSSSMEQ